jgi:hypothetical protein
VRGAYLVVGGLAVVAHGFVRLTADIDLVLDPDPGALRRAIQALSALGYRPRAPVDFAEFADPRETQALGARQGAHRVLGVQPRASRHRGRSVLETPFDFERAYARAARFQLADGIEGTFVGLDDLIAMKRAAARPQDLDDVEGLRSLQRREGASACLTIRATSGCGSAAGRVTSWRSAGAWRASRSRRSSSGSRAPSALVLTCGAARQAGRSADQR